MEERTAPELFDRMLLPGVLLLAAPELLLSVVLLLLYEGLVLILGLL